MTTLDGELLKPIDESVREKTYGDFSYFLIKEEFSFFEKGPSAPSSNPLKPICAVNSFFPVFPSRIFKSNTPEVALP